LIVRNCVRPSVGLLNLRVIPCMRAYSLGAPSHKGLAVACRTRTMVPSRLAL
jgi:hypothetical protein